jgi:hypothetical protein
MPGVADGGGGREERLFDRSRLASIVKRYMDSKAPGYFNSLDISCRKFSSKSCIDLLIDEPDRLRDVLANKLGNNIYTAYFIIKHLFLRPILIKLDRLDVEEELATLFIQNPEKFREKLKQILNI